MGSAFICWQISARANLIMYIHTPTTRSPTRHAFDAVLMANVLCRLPDPKAALEGIAGVYM